MRDAIATAPTLRQQAYDQQSYMAGKALGDSRERSERKMAVAYCRNGHRHSGLMFPLSAF